MVSKTFYKNCKADWKDIWNYRLKKQSVIGHYYNPGCPACKIMHKLIDETWRNDLAVNTICEGVCPIDYSYLVKDHWNDHLPMTCQNYYSRYMVWRNERSPESIKAILMLTKWFTYEEYVTKVEEFFAKTAHLEIDMEYKEGTNG